MLLMMGILTISEFADREIDQWFMFIFDTLMLMMLRIWHLEVDDDYNFDIEDVDDVENFDTYKLMMMMRILTLKTFMMIFY